MTPAEHERLALLLEEMGEAQQVVGKILRHGWGPHTFLGIAYDNRLDLEKELGDVWAAMIRLTAAGDIRFESIEARADKKTNDNTYMRHQDD